MSLRVKSGALACSMAVAIAHFSVSMLLCRQANLIFQHSFDTGEFPNGADQVVLQMYKLLDVPFPVLLLAGHPARTSDSQLWLLNAINSLCWAAAAYLLHVSVAAIIGRLRGRTA